MGRFVRFASLGFATGSAVYWLGIAGFVQIIFAIDEQVGVPAGGQWASQAVPTIIYGVACVLFCHWFARGVVKRIPPGPFD